MRRALVALGLATALVTFAPWGSSGDRSRSSYELVEVAGRSGVLPERLDAVAGTWYLIPAVCGVVVLLTAVGRARLAGIAGSSLGLVVVAGAVLVVRSPLVTEPAAVAGLVVGAATAVCGIATVLGVPRQR